MPIFGNGDIDGAQKALEYRNKYGVDGIMIGRAAIGYPWIFDEIKHYFTTGNLLAPPTVNQRIEVVRKHIDFSIRWKGPVVGIFEMRPHYGQYFKGVANFKEYRTKLVMAPTIDDIYEILNEISMRYDGVEVLG